jgi:uncharacterized lipoprotein NlpE involved in copper resistance
LRASLIFKWLAISLGLLVGTASAQQWIQVPVCGNTPQGVNPSAATIAVNPSGQVCILGASSVVIATPLAVTITGTPVAVTQSGSPISVAIASSPVNVTGNFSTTVSSPLGVNIAQTTPLNVTIATSPVAVQGSFTATQTGNNIVQLSGQQLASPSTYGAAPVGSVQGVNAFVTNNVAVTPPTPLGVTLPASPVSVGVANSNLAVTTTPGVSPVNVTVANSPLTVSIGSSPVNVTGNFSTASPSAQNLVAVQGVNIASPSTYGSAPVGSVAGVNAFVTNNVAVTTPTPLQVTLPASPISVGIAGPTPLNVTVGNTVSVTPPTPLQVTLPASPISVGISATPLNVTVNNSPVAVSIASSPVNVTGNFTSTQTGTNLVQLSGQQLASPSTYGAAPVGSVQGVNAFVTNNVNVTTPTPLQVTLPASPISVGISATPLNVTVNNSPVAVSIASSPVNVTGTFTATQTGNNIVQQAGQQLASPSTYGSAPVGSVAGVNAFVTNNVNVTPPTPLGVTLPASPISVGIAGPTPLNITISGSPVSIVGNITTSQTGNNIVQLAGQQLASPNTYGSAPVGSVQGVNAFVTNNVAVTPPTPLGVTLPASPISVGIAGPTPLNVTLGTSPVSVSISTVSSPINVTGNFATASPSAQNLVQVQNVNIASPSTYGSAPVGSVAGVNAFVTNNVAVTPPTPLGVTLPASPISVGISATPLNVTVGGIVSPQNVTLQNSPIAVNIASSPVNVTGNFSTTATGTNLVQIDGQQIASPSTYGSAPVGSVQGVNAFITNNVAVTTPTPLGVTLPASPISVGLSGSPVSVGAASGNYQDGAINTIGARADTVTNGSLSGSVVGYLRGIFQNIQTPLAVTPQGSPASIVVIGSPMSVVQSQTPQNVTVASSPIAVTVASSPVAVTGTFSSTGTNIVQVDGQQIASPSTYGQAPIGSTLGVNAFVTNNVAVTPPTPLGVTLPASPISVGIAGPTPLNVTVGGIISPQQITLPASPISVGFAASPLNVTVASPQANNLIQVQNVNIASPSTYGSAPVGSVAGVNAFVTNQPTVVLSGSPVSVAITSGSSPINVTVASPQANNMVQWQGVNIASPSTYGVAPVGSTAGVNAFMTNANPNGLATMANSQPTVVASDQTPITINMLGGGTAGGATNGNIIAWTATTAFGVTNTVVALGATPGIVGIHQLNGASCFANQNVATPPAVVLEIFDATPHASGTDVTLGTTLPKVLIGLSGSPMSVGQLIQSAPGNDFTKGIAIAFVATANGSNAVGTRANCTFSYN